MEEEVDDQGDVPAKSGRNLPFQVIPVVIGVVVVAATVGWLLYEQRESTKVESRRMMGVGVGYLEKGDKMAARACLSSAVALDPGNAEAQRLLNSLGDEGLVPVAKRGPNGEVVEGEVTMVEPVPVPVIPEVPTVMPEKAAESPRLDPELVEKHLKRAEELAGEKNWEGVEASLREAVAVDLGVKSKRLLAKFLMGRPMGPEEVPEVLELLRAVGQSQTVEGAAALSTALIKGMVPNGEIAAWLTLIRAHPNATMPMLLATDRVDVQLRPRDKTTVAAEAVKRVEGAPVVDRAAVLQWLSEIGEEQQGLKLLEMKDVMGDRVMFEVWILVRARMGDWAAVMSAVDQPGNPLPPHASKMLRGRALTGMGKEKEGRELYREVVGEAGGDRKRVIEALAMLAALNEQEEFEREFGNALRDPDGAEAIFRGVTPAVYRSRDALRVRRLYEIASESPVLKENVRVKAALSHYRLMLGMDEDIVELAGRTERAVDDPVPRVTLALALLNLGDRVRALSELEEKKPDIDVTSLGVSQQAVVAAVLAANFRRDEALGMVARMPMDQLTELEQEWLRGYLNGDVEAKYQMKVKEAEEASWKKTARRIGIDAGIVVLVLVIWRVYMRIRYGRLVWGGS